MAVPNLDELKLLHEQMCQAVADPKRIQILYALYDHPRNVSELAELLNTPQPTISRHLAILRQRSLVEAERDGAAVVYRLVDTRIIDVLNMMRQLLVNVLQQRATTMT